MIDYKIIKNKCNKNFFYRKVKKQNIILYTIPAKKQKKDLGLNLSLTFLKVNFLKKDHEI